MIEDQGGAGYTGTVYEAVQYARTTKGAIAERTENRTSQKIWCCRFTCPEAEVNPGKVLWLEGNADGSWLTPEEGKWFSMCISLRRSVSVKFPTLEAACKFMQMLRPAEVQ